MKTKTFVKKTYIPASVDDVFQWHSRPGALERLTPPWENVRIISKTGGIEKGAKTSFVINAGPIPIKWSAEHCDFIENQMFRDIQTSGPFAKWEHTHIFTPDGPNACFMEDHIEYALPFAMFGNIFGEPFVRAKLNRMFEYRHRVTIRDIFLMQKKRKNLKIVISGASGVLGSKLIPFLTTQGHTVIKLVRRKPSSENEAQWNPDTEFIDPNCLKNADAVIHLAGEQIGEDRWTNAKKKRIVDSRVKGTNLLASAIAKSDSKPIFLSASAIGFYGNRGEQNLVETDPKGNDFISYVCDEWEKATQPAIDKGIRIVSMRIGIVLTPSGGALARFLTPFKMGLGCTINAGNQYMSWISLDDIIGAIYHTLLDNNITGPVNMVSPNPICQKDFSKILAKVIKRPLYFNVPGWLIRTAFGEMGKEVLLSGTKVIPKKLIESGYDFVHPDLESALRHVLGIYA